MKANLRTEFQSGSDYYQLLDIARKIEAENMPVDSTTETNKPANSKGKPKVGAITVDSTTAQQLSQLQGAVKGLTNLVKGVQLNTNTTQSSQNPNPGTGQPTPQTKILHLHLKAEVIEMVDVEVEVEEVSDLGQVKSCAIGVRILFLKRKLVTR